MLCSSGFSSPNGSPYWMPTARSPAASARMATSAPAGRPQRLRAPAGSDLGWAATDELGDVAGADEDGVDAGPLEREHLVAAVDGGLGDRELPDRNVRKQVEHVVERVVVVVDVPAGEQHDLGVEPLEHE